MRSLHAKNNSLSIAFIFLASIGLLLLGGMLLKLFLLLRASSFDGVHQYIVEVDESNQKGALIAYNPTNQSVEEVAISGKVDSTFGQYLGVPVDAKVHMPLTSDMVTVSRNMLFHTGRDMTIIDSIRLNLFVNSLKKSSFHFQAITLPVDASITDKLLPSLFLDNTLYFDNASVSVVNATGESGIGSEVAHMLTTIGINVVSVTTADTVQENSMLFAHQTSSYTVGRIGRIFHVDSEGSTGALGISDITLTIGKKSLSQLQ